MTRSALLTKIGAGMLGLSSPSQIFFSAASQAEPERRSKRKPAAQGHGTSCGLRYERNEDVPYRPNQRKCYDLADALVDFHVTDGYLAMTVIIPTCEGAVTVAQSGGPPGAGRDDITLEAGDQVCVIHR